MKEHLLMRLVSLTLAVASLSVGAAYAETAEDRVARFQLFDSCRPMQMLVEDLPPKAAQIGLTRPSLMSAVESRLRSARLYAEDASSVLYLRVNVVGHAFSVNLE